MFSSHKKADPTSVHRTIVDINDMLNIDVSLTASSSLALAKIDGLHMTGKRVNSKDLKYVGTIKTTSPTFVYLKQEHRHEKRNRVSASS